MHKHMQYLSKVKCLLTTKGFLKGHVTLKMSWMLKMLLCITGINYMIHYLHYKYMIPFAFIKRERSYFKLH